MRKLLLLGLLMSFGWMSFAQDKSGDTAKKPEAKPEQASAMPAPKPSPEIQKLAKLMSGRFRVSGKIQDEMWAKGGDEGVGSETTKSGPGGFTLISDAQMKFKKIGPLLGHGVMWYDDAKKAYQGLWCDNGGPACTLAGEGKWDGDKLVFEGEMMMGDQKIPLRQSYSNFSATGFDWAMEAGDGKGGWKPEMSLKYTKATAAKSAETASTKQQ